MSDDLDLWTAADQSRAAAQLQRVKLRLLDHQWYTLAELSAATGDPESSVSARIRDLRKVTHGQYQIDRRRRSASQWEYRLAREDERNQVTAA